LRARAGWVHPQEHAPERQAEHVDLVSAASGAISSLLTLSPGTVRDAMALMRKYRVSGVPITDKNGVLVGSYSRDSAEDDSLLSGR
jgi:IMP dehydrogenase